MENTQLFPFERNRYYPKKRMSSGDFTAEQTYMNNKRRFLNGLMYGSGVVCGLGVFSLDDLSLLVESGVAIDGLGREIVVEASDVKKLSAIAGFDDLRTNRASLCLRYSEEDVHKVYAIDQEEPNTEFKFNRVREGYTLFLMDSEDIPASFEPEGEFLTKSTLLSDEHYLLSFSMPAMVSRGHAVKGVLTVRKLSDADVPLTYFGTLQTPAFVSPDGRNEIQVDIRDLDLAKGESAVYEYWMLTTNHPVQSTNIILETGTAGAYENGTKIDVPANFAMEVVLSDQKPRELVNREIGRVNLEMRSINARGDYIRLCDLVLVRTEGAYIIEEVIETGIKKYVTIPAQEMLRGDYLEYFIKEPDIREQPAESHALPAGDEPQAARDDIRIATGTLEIPIGDDARRGDIFYSGEIMHGLGAGNVYVDVGYEFIEDDSQVRASAKSTIYGCAGIFAKEQRSVVEAETAVRVLNDKGSFVVGARLTGDVDYLILNYRWVAIRFPSGELDHRNLPSGGGITPETPTVRMAAKESHYFGVRFTNMEPVSITYEMTEHGSGEITPDGIYTAPTKPGVYEIRIFCTDMPRICTYAYAIVEKRGLKDASEVETLRQRVARDVLPKGIG